MRAFQQPTAPSVVSPPASQGTTSTGITGDQGTTISKEGHIGVSRG